MAAPDGGALVEVGGRAGRQLALFPEAVALAAADLSERLARGLGAQARLTLTGNRTSLLTFRRAPSGTVHVRIQRVFLRAPDDVLEAVISFIRAPSRSSRERVVSFFLAQPEAADRRRAAQRSPASLRPRGRVHDLVEIRDALSARYFDGRLRPAITWGERGRGEHAAVPVEPAAAAEARVRTDPGAGRAASAYGPRPMVRGARPTPRGARTIRFGSYLAANDLIRVHPALDSESVPRFFVESIVYHEMLHALIPIVRDPEGRRVIHPPEFRRRERTFHAFDDSVRWERANLRRLLEARG